MVSCIDHLARHSRQTLRQRQISLVLRFQPDSIELAARIGNGNPEAVATIAGLTEVAGMAAPAMADETAADPMVGQTQSADPTKDALDKANTAVSESQTGRSIQGG